jgi:hypothetical protein
VQGATHDQSAGGKGGNAGHPSWDLSQAASPRNLPTGAIMGEPLFLVSDPDVQDHPQISQKDAEDGEPG